MQTRYILAKAFAAWPRDFLCAHLGLMQLFPVSLTRQNLAMDNLISDTFSEHSLGPDIE